MQNFEVRYMERPLQDTVCDLLETVEENKDDTDKKKILNADEDKQFLKLSDWNHQQQKCISSMSQFDGNLRYF